MDQDGARRSFNFLALARQPVQRLTLRLIAEYIGGTWLLGPRNALQHRVDSSATSSVGTAALRDHLAFRSPVAVARAERRS